MSRSRMLSVFCALGLACVWLALNGPIAPTSEQRPAGARAYASASFPQDVGTLSGTVSSADGTPLSGAALHLLSDRPIVAGGRGTATAEGRFEIPVAPRSYTVTAWAAGYWPRSQQITVTAGTTRTLSFVLPRQHRALLPVVLRGR